MGERVELSESELKKVAKYMSEEINGNIDAHIAEALKLHSIRIDLKWGEIIDKFNTEAHAAFDQQQRSIECIDQKVEQVWHEIDILKKDRPVYYLPKKASRILFWTSFAASIVAIVYLLINQL